MNIIKKMTQKGPKDKPLDIINTVKSDVERYFKQFEKLKKEEEEAYYGVIWKNSNQYRPYENIIFELIETTVPILSDNFPAPIVQVNDPSKINQAKNLQKALQWVNEDQDLILKYPEAIRNALIAGPGWIYAYYDANANNGQGRNIYELLKWNKVKLSGRTSNIEDCDKARIELSRSRDWLCLTYPKFAEKIKELKGQSDVQDSADRGKETVDSGAGYSKRIVPTEYKDDDTLKLILTYKRDYSIVPISQEDTEEELEHEAESLQNGLSPDVSKWQDHNAHLEVHENERLNLYMQLGIDSNIDHDEAAQIVDQLIAENPEAEENFSFILKQIYLLEMHMEEHEVLSQENPTGGKLKYPKGYRELHSIQELVIYDGPNRHDHGEIPLVPFYCYRDGTIYGSSMTRNILDSQRMQAVMGYKAYKGLQKVANPEKEVNEESGLTVDDITNEDGAIYGVKKGTSWTVRNLGTGQISEQINRFQNEKIERMQMISGVTNPTRGEMPDHRVSELTVSKVQNQALGRIRLKDRQNQFYSLKRLGKLVVSDILQFWSMERVLYLENEGDEMKEIIFNPLEMQDLEYEIKIAPGAMAGIDKDAFNNVAALLLNGGHITFKQFAEIADIPRIAKIKEFADANDQIKAQAQDLQAQLEQLTQENIKLKGSLDPNLLSPEEMKAMEDMARQEQLQNLTGANYGQPEQF